ncbi:MAG: hypothetical protein E7293_03545 [Lachnospiraceae bacterium]|nr:hypothetical protein [Lachnospiraceae bacterium]
MLQLPKEERYDFRKRIINPHVPDLRDQALAPQADEYALPECVKIYGEKEFGIVVQHAAEDFRQFLSISMGISVQETCREDADIVLQISKDLGEYSTYKGYQVHVGEQILITGYDERGLAQALYNLEDIMVYRRAPYLKKGDHYWKPMYAPMMIHSGYGFDQYPDEYLREVARNGRDTIMIFVKDVNKTPHGFLDFNDVIQRAAKYGIDVYAYSNMHSERHPSDPDAEAHYEASYGRLFAECPGFKGLILCGESVEFPSKDPHVSNLHYYNNRIDGIPTGKPSPGWFPCYDYPEWLRLLQKIIYRHKQDVDIVFWSYNWCRAPEEDRVKLIENLPEGITLQATFEMGEGILTGDLQNYCADYTLSFTGPGKYFTSEAIAAKKRNIKLYSMTNTAGMTWDFGVVPYEPMAQSWQKRYKEMEKAHDQWGLSGIMECHHYGMYPSFITKLSKWTFSEPRIPYDQLLEGVLASEYGAKHVKTIEKGLALWSEALTWYIPSDADQYGAFRVGPSYPLCVNVTIGMQPAPEAVCKGICYTGYIDNVQSPNTASFPSLRVPEEIKSLEKMKELFAQGLAVLEEIPDKNEKLLYLINQGHFMLHAIITGIHAKQLYCLKCNAKATRDRQQLIQIVDDIEALIKEEIQNAESTIPYVNRDSRLGYEPSMEYLGDEWHIRWKLRHAEYVLNTEIADWKAAARL